MKNFIFVFLLASILAPYGFAVETTTECPMMREANLRSNPKSNLEARKPKSGTKATGATAI